MNFKFLHCNFKFDVVFVTVPSCLTMRYEAIVTIIFFLISNFFTLKPFKINFNNFSIYLNLHTVPILCIIVLLASRCIGGEQLKYGFVGDETHLRPYDILLLFLSLVRFIDCIPCTIKAYDFIGLYCVIARCNGIAPVSCILGIK